MVMGFFSKDKSTQARESSIKLPDGGDTHVHSNPDRTITITERTKEIENHYTFDENGNRIS